MVKNKKDRGRKLAAGRWCVDCGINPPPGEFRYIIGNPICILGDLFVICRTCEKLKEGVKENGTALLVCRDCLQVARAAEDRIKAEKQVEERRRGQVENMGEQERRPRVRVYYNIPAGLSEYLSRLGIKVLSPEEST